MFPGFKIICNLFVRQGYPLETLSYQLCIPIVCKKEQNKVGNLCGSSLVFVMPL